MRAKNGMKKTTDSPVNCFEFLFVCYRNHSITISFSLVLVRCWLTLRSSSRHICLRISLVDSFIFSKTTFSVLRGYLCLTIAFAVNANQIHKFAHTRQEDIPSVVKGFQSIGLSQSPAQHHLHHQEPYQTNYCPMTNYLNPVLDTLGFWNGVRWGLVKLGLPPAV